MIKGLDNGYDSTKDNQFRIFKSAFTQTDKSINSNNKIIIDGVTYFVGDGEMTVDVNKIDLEINKIGTLYNLAMTGAEQYYLTVGLPIKQYNKYADQFRDTVLSYNKCKVVFNDKEYKFHINDVMVYPQGAASLYCINTVVRKYIIVDIGGLTIDIALIEIEDDSSVKISKCDTWYKGIRKLYTSIIDSVNLKFETRLEVSDAEDILLNGLRVRGKNEDLNFLQPTIQEYLQPIIEEIKLNYPTDTTPMYLSGGGSLLLHDAFKKRFYEVELIKDSQFSNALGYYYVGLDKYSKYEKR